MITLLLNLTYILHFYAPGAVPNAHQGFGGWKSYLSSGAKTGRKLMKWVRSKELISFIVRYCLLS